MKKRILQRCILNFLIFSSILLSGLAVAEYSFVDDADAIEKTADSIYMLEVYSSNHRKIGVGSGFAAFNPFLIITNYHVIEDGSYVIAISDDQEQFVISKVCAYDRKRDIAILMADNDLGAEPLILDEDYELKRSQPVVAIGSPAGLRNTVSIGNISAFYQKDGKDWIQFTAPISSGSSGGALLNDQGNVIGMTTATYASTQNINMAVRASEIISVFQSWDGRRTIQMAGVTGAATPAGITLSGNTSPTDTNYVYVTASGTKYHNNPNCSKMRNPVQIDLMEAIGRGYEPCGKCYK